MRPAAFLLALAAAATAQAQFKSDWELKNEDRLKQSEERLVPPPPLERAKAVEVKLHASADTGFRFFVDPGSVSAGDDRIVRYTLVARSPNGSEYITYEGIRCPGEYRVYAVARPDGSWGGRASEWRPIPRNANSGQATLARQYFCPGRAAVATSAEGQRAVRNGGHPGLFTDSRDNPN